MFSNKLPDTKSRIFGSSNESSSLYARLSEVTASLTRNKQVDLSESNGLPPLRGKMPSSRQKSNTLPHLGHGPQVQQLYDDDQRHHAKLKEDILPKVQTQQGDQGKVGDSCYRLFDSLFNVCLNMADHGYCGRSGNVSHFR